MTDQGDALDRIDATIEELCACGCRARLRANGPSGYWASQECQRRWNNQQATAPQEVYERLDAHLGHIPPAEDPSGLPLPSRLEVLVRQVVSAQRETPSHWLSQDSLRGPEREIRRSRWEPSDPVEATAGIRRMEFTATDGSRTLIELDRTARVNLEFSQSESAEDITPYGPGRPTWTNRLARWDPVTEMTVTASWRGPYRITEYPST